MFTSIDKALISGFGVATYLVKSLLDIDIGVSDETFLAIVGAVTPILVFLVPNKPWTS
jgi:hypothetical protein